MLEIAQASRRNNAYLNSLTAAQNLMLQYGRARRPARYRGAIQMWVIDSPPRLTATGAGVRVRTPSRWRHDHASCSRLTACANMYKP